MGSEATPEAPRRTDPRLELPATERLKVHEIFYSLQGESTRAGRPCVLVRLTGCQMRCTWCDSEYAFYEGRWATLEEVTAEVEAFGCDLVEVTGGEPLLQPGCLPLLTRLCDAGHEVLLETGGGLDVSRVDPRVRRIVDIKCPASGEADANLWSNLDHLRPTDELKLVVADRADYEWARERIDEHDLPAICPVSLSPVFGAVDPRELAEWVLQDRLRVRLQLQLHKLLWGPDATGV